MPRYSAEVVLLPNGKVLVAGARQTRFKGVETQGVEPGKESAIRPVCV